MIVADIAFENDELEKGKQEMEDAIRALDRIELTRKDIAQDCDFWNNFPRMQQIYYTLIEAAQDSEEFDVGELISKLHQLGTHLSNNSKNEFGRTFFRFMPFYYEGFFWLLSGISNGASLDLDTAIREINNGIMLLSECRKSLVRFDNSTNLTEVLATIDHASNFGDYLIHTFTALKHAQSLNVSEAIINAKLATTKLQEIKENERTNQVRTLSIIKDLVETGEELQPVVDQVLKKDTGIEDKLPTIQKMVQNRDLLAVMIEDIRELNINYIAGRWKSTIIIAGSITEALIYSALKKHEHSAIQAIAKLKITNKNSVDDLDLYQMINVAKELNLLPMAGMISSHALREHRNLVHPLNVAKENYEINQSQASIAVETIKNLINHMERILP